MTTRPTNEEIRTEWRAAGGSFHGPNVETVTMTEADYFKFRRSLLVERQAARDGVDEEMSNLFRLLDHADGGEWRWSENGNIITDKPQEGNDPEIAAVYTEHEDDSEPINSMAICAAINFLRKNRAALRSVAKPITSISDALNFLEKWALAGNTLHGDDVQQFHATVERIAPVAKTVMTPDTKPRVFMWRRHGRDSWKYARWIPTSNEVVMDMRIRGWDVEVLYTSPPPQQAMPEADKK